MRRRRRAIRAGSMSSSSIAGASRSSTSRRGEIGARPFLDLPDDMLADGNEQGLLGLAFHPDYADEPAVLRVPDPGGRRRRGARLPPRGGRSRPCGRGERRHDPADRQGQRRRQPQRRLDRLRAGRAAACRGRRRGAGWRSVEQRPEQGRALGQDAADRRRRRRLRRRGRATMRSRTTIRSSAGPGATRSGRSGCATRGGRASTGRPATSTRRRRAGRARGDRRGPRRPRRAGPTSAGRSRRASGCSTTASPATRRRTARR